jgi:outer membrane receptor for ferrienterochelin and colicin
MEDYTGSILSHFDQMTQESQREEKVTAFRSQENNTCVSGCLASGRLRVEVRVEQRKRDRDRQTTDRQRQTGRQRQTETDKQMQTETETDR